MKKIMYICPYTLPTEKALGVQIVQMCAAFAKGVEVELLIPKSQKKEDVFSFYGVPETFQVVSFPARSYGVRGSLAYWVKLVSFAMQVRRYARKAPGAVLYGREPALGFFFKDFFLELHTLPTRTTFIHRFLWKRPRGIIALTSFIKKELVDAGVPADRVHVAHDAAPETFLAANNTKEDMRVKFELPTDRKIVAYVGKYQSPFGKGKGVDELVAMFPQVQKEISNAFLLLVGVNKDLVASVQEKCRAAGVRDADARIISHVPHESVIELMQSADVLVMNYPWSEHHAYQMSPMKLFEYMAARRAIVASALPSICEVVDDTMVHLIEPGNAEALKQGLVRVLEDEKYAEGIAREAYRKVQSHTWKSRAQNVINFMLSSQGL